MLAPKKWPALNREKQKQPQQKRPTVQVALTMSAKNAKGELSDLPNLGCLPGKAKEPPILHQCCSASGWVYSSPNSVLIDGLGSCHL
jgi:hypothetical protein